MDFSKAGLKSFKKYLWILLWVAISGALASLIEYVSNLKFEAPVYVASMAIINYLLKAALTWVSTQKK
ncbi:MAG: hypothetical protein WCX73_06040 [Candidatus Pacearchaeota archaeon]|jgi:hypothetical protein